MIFNATQKYRFRNRLHLSGETLEVVPKTKLMSVVVHDDLKWDANTAILVKRAIAQMLLLRKLSEFEAPREDITTIYIV